MDSKKQAPSSSNVPPHTSSDLSELLLGPQDIEVLLGLAKNDTDRQDIKMLNSRWDWYMKFSEELKLSKLEKKMPQDSGKSELMNNNQELLAKLAKVEAESADYMEALARERELSLAAKNDLREAQLENARSTKEILMIMREYKESLVHAEEEKALNRASHDEAIKQVAYLRGCVDQLSEDRNRLFSQLLDLQAGVGKYTELSSSSTFEMRSELESKEKLIIELKTRLAEADEKIVEGEKLRKKLLNAILELKGNIRVFCRVRPLLSSDGVGNDANVVSFPTSTEMQGRGIDLTTNGQKYSFTFDKVFMPNNSQEDVFEEISELVQSALDGYKVCIFAYGQTGSGKTHTMIGIPGLPDQKGLIPRSLEQIFTTRHRLEDEGWKYEMQASMYEVYNEAIRDLLATNKSTFDTPLAGGTGKQYAIRHDANGNSYVTGLTIVDVCSSNEVSDLLERAAQNRTDQRVEGVLNLIDLAGGQRLSKTEATGSLLLETQAINKSLFALCEVITALVNKAEHVPFRNSKLTHILQPYLGGNSKTLMFVNVSPDPSSASESICSLRFASRVNGCKI